MPRTVLITGGAGFIGSHLADELLAHGYRVRALDNLHPQVHGPRGKRPAYLSSRVELQIGDVRDESAVTKALQGVDAVVHLAARVGVGQSMYEVAHYVSANDGGTAVLMQTLSERRVERLVVASSMSVYGEGLYRTPDGTLVEGTERSPGQLHDGVFELLDPEGRRLEPVPTPETKRPALASVYALSKYAQERLCLLVGQAYGIPTLALRLFNVYGPRQALSNPYTGVLAIFASRLLNGRPPRVYEDGLQRRDFVHVRDVARAFRLAIEQPKVSFQALNVGSGRSVTVLEVARELGKALGRQDVEPELTGEYRVGDVRHCFCEVSRAEELLGYRPEVELAAGLEELGVWLAGQKAEDLTDRAGAELSRRGLTVQKRAGRAAG